MRVRIEFCPVGTGTDWFVDVWWRDGWKNEGVYATKDAAVKWANELAAMREVSK